MGQQRRQRHAHNDQKPRQEPAEIDNRAAAATGGRGIHKVVGRGATRAEPVGQGRERVGGDDEEGQVVVVEGGGEDAEEEADG